MFRSKALIVLMMFLVYGLSLSAQVLKPGFDRDEYVELMKLSSRMGDSTYYRLIPAPQKFKRQYRSPVLGLDNRWELWTAGNGLAAISIRGTTTKQVSWLENFYAAMVPAKGKMQLSSSDSFPYQLSQHPQAAVHVGWLTGLGFLAPTILQKIDSCHRAGINDFLIMGHSQGGAIAYLLTAYLLNLQQVGELSTAIRFKTYCSAAPKPGNLYFAYDYEALTAGGWAFNVVNTADWVPETPVSVQTLNDFNPVNPFANAEKVISKMKFPQNLLLRFVFGQLNNPLKRSQKNFENYLGQRVEEMVKKELKGFQPPAYYSSNHYVRTGSTIVLRADEEYYSVFTQSNENVFVNHLHQPYLYLVYRQIYGLKAEPVSTLEGTWELQYITGTRMAFEGLYPGKRPVLRIDLQQRKVSGHTSCNSFTAPLLADGYNLDFPEALSMTEMKCSGGGEEAFIRALSGVTSYSVEKDRLSLLKDDIVLMRFSREKDNR